MLVSLISLQNVLEKSRNIFLLALQRHINDNRELHEFRLSILFPTAHGSPLYRFQKLSCSIIVSLVDDPSHVVFSFTFQKLIKLETYPLHEPVVDLRVHDYVVGRETDLAAIQELREQYSSGSDIKICCSRNDCRSLTLKLEYYEGQP